MFCEHCGQEIENDSEFCTHCGMPVATDDASQGRRLQSANRSNTVKPRPINERTYTQPNAGNYVKGTGASTVALAEGEVIVKQYNCANVKGVAGYLTVTNKRMMFNASGGANNSRYSQEVTLSSVSGFTCHRGTNFNLKLMIIGGLLVIAGIYAIASSGGESLFNTIGIISLAVGALLIYLGIRPAFQIIVYAKDVSPSPINIGEGPRSLLGNQALFAIISTPTSDTDLMISELGALVQDLQTMGDLAIEKWQNRVSSGEIPKI